MEPLEFSVAIPAEMVIDTPTAVRLRVHNRSSEILHKIHLRLVGEGVAHVAGRDEIDISTLPADAHDERSITIFSYAVGAGALVVRNIAYRAASGRVVAVDDKRFPLAATKASSLPPSPPPRPSPVDRVKLLADLTERFDLSELRTLCFKLEIDHEKISVGSKTDFARELIRYCERINRLTDLDQLAKKERGDGSSHAD